MWMVPFLIAAGFIFVSATAGPAPVPTNISQQEADFRQVSAPVETSRHADRDPLLAASRTKPATPGPRVETDETLTEAIERLVRVNNWYAENPDVAPRYMRGARRINTEPRPVVATGKPGTVVASWYGSGFHGRPMANGKRYNMYDPTVVAHKTLPLGTKIEAVNIKNGKRTVLTVQDRGPYIPGRELDLSKEAAAILGLKPGTPRDEGLAVVRMKVLFMPTRRKTS